MKKNLFSVAVLALSLAACHSTPKFTIDGTVVGKPTGKVLLIAQQDTLAKADVVEGKFTLSGTVDGLTDANLIMEGAFIGVRVFLENAVFTAKLNTGNDRDNKVEGTESQNLYNEFRALDGNSFLPFQYISSSMENLIKAHADSYVSAYVVASAVASASAREVEGLQRSYNLLGENAKNSKWGKQAAARIKNLSAVMIGKVAPDFTLKTPEGQPLSLHSIKAKAKLIDFWASWCGPCRRENPNVLAVYKKYHAKGLEVVSVSLDNEKAKWLEAIQKDGVIWHNVSSLKGRPCEVARQYCINGIPHLILLDENNVIVADNLRGDDLEKAVAKLLK